MWLTMMGIFTSTTGAISGDSLLTTSSPYFYTNWQVQSSKLTNGIVQRTANSTVTNKNRYIILLSEHRIRRPSLSPCNCNWVDGKWG